MASKKPTSPEDDDLLKAALDDFRNCEEAEQINRTTGLDDLRFVKLLEQWPENIQKERKDDGRPCLTIDKLGQYVRQVVNDARQNKPAIKVHAADSGSDPATAQLMDGLIRNIEYTSNADTAYDTATECAVTCGFGYLRVSLDYAFDDSFDMDLMIKRVSNPFSIYGDPNSTEADSSDWDKAFVADRLTKRQFEAQYGDKAKVDWDDTSWSDAGTSWREDDTVTVAEWWTREEVDRPIVLLSDGSIRDMEEMQQEQMQFLLQAGQIQVVRERVAKSHKVTQRIMSGVEILETRDWPGRYIPIIPVYGDAFDVQGKRYFRSMIHNAKDAQAMYNFQRSAATELIALAPRVPFIGEQGAFDVDIDRWNTANNKSHPFLEYTKGKLPPQRQPMDTGRAAGAIQESLNASDDIKGILGMYDASLGARSNETSGRAIMARQREGDVSTFHFIDNMARAIRHTGRILIDLIPKVYDAPRIVRVIGEDGEQQTKQINQPFPQVDPQTGQPMVDAQGQAIMAIHDLTAGKYDLTVTTGPSFTSRREEASMQMTEMIRAFPASAPIVGPELAKNLDWPGADKIAEKMEAMSQGPQIPDEVKKQVQDMQVQMQQLQEENQKLKQDQSDKIAAIQADQQIQMIKVQSEEKIAAAKIQSNQQIEFYKAQNSAAMAAAKLQQGSDSAN